MPKVKQVRATMPTAFKEKFPITFVIIDGSEIFTEVASDLHMESSRWSSYKHHNTIKFCFISPVSVGSISDVELTKLSDFLEVIELTLQSRLTEVYNKRHA